MLRAVADRVGEGQTYVAVTADGGRMAAISKKLDSREINQIVTRTNGVPLKQRLIDFSNLTEKKVDDQARSSTIGMYVTLGVLIALAAVATGSFLVVRKRRQERTRGAWRTSRPGWRRTSPSSARTSPAST